MRSYPAVKENPIGSVSVVSDILRYKQTNILLLYYKDYLINKINKKKLCIIVFHIKIVSFI